MTLLVHRRNDFAEMLKQAGVETNTVHIRSDLYTLFKPYAKGAFPSMDKVEARYICLPIHSKVTAGDVRKICNLIKKGW
jgi:dTDP-4-amino-4,6-dideoxygalactose transaminase